MIALTLSLYLALLRTAMDSDVYAASYLGTRAAEVPRRILRSTQEQWHHHGRQTSALGQEGDEI